MALPILDGNQSATTLSTILSSGQHITAHTVVSLGTQAITDISGAVSGSVVSISNFPASQIISGTVTANPTGTQTIAGTVTANVPNLVQEDVDSSGFYGVPAMGKNPDNDTYKILKIDQDGILAISGTVTVGNSVTIGSTPAIQWSNANAGGAPTTVNQNAPLPVQLYVGAVPTSVTLGATITNSVTIGSLPAISGTVTANTFALQGTAVTTSDFTSTTASTVLASYNATREVLTIFNEGAGNLHIAPGATCTTIAYQVRLSAGDYYEVPNHQTTITHSAVFATAGTARVTEVT
jgi:hypothetical protein